jgi:photosystem II stability/assembly factor-like uncharacterized protein
MQRIIAALVLSVALSPVAFAAEQVNYDDAALHAVQFVDREEGWAVGDEGVIWHTIDGGRNWERQPTGVRASLRSLHFLNPYTGWVVGREEQPYGAGSIGVILFTQDGGLKWRRAGENTLPGLNHVHFIDNKTGFVVGDGTEQFSTGVFTTSDNGRTWKPVAGARGPGWLAADFQDAETGVLAGPWGQLATLRKGALAPADVDTLGGRSLRGLQVVGKCAIAVGQGGLVLVSADSAGSRWGYADLALPTEVRAAWDFHAVHALAKHVWIAGRPGSAILHSADLGQKWEVLTTGQPLPLNGICFIDEMRGWAVGEFGSVLNTVDGGKSWKVQHRGGQRAAVLFVHARPAGLPVDTIAVLGAQEGYLASAVRVNSADPASAAPLRAGDADRFAAAVRRAGGAAGEQLWQFPIAQHLARADRGALVRTWNRMHADRAAEEMLRQLVLTLRIWRPDVVITDHPDVEVTGSPAEALTAEAMHEAFTRAADPKAFPEQIEKLGLEPWKAGKLYGRWDSRAKAQVVLDLNEPSARLGATARDFASPAAGLLADVAFALPTERCYRLLESRLEGADRHRNLMDGIILAPQGVARRELKPLEEREEVVLKAIRARRNLQAIADPESGSLSDPGKLLAQIGPALEGMSTDQGAAAAFALASQYVRLGQWQYAREAFLLMVDRYPAHPLSADAYRWLIRHNCSSEALRRHEMGQFLILSEAGFATSNDKSNPVANALEKKAKIMVQGKVEETHDQRLALLSNRTETRQWYQGSLDIGARLAGFGPLFATDPSIQFCLQAARRNLGDFDTARQWYTRFRDEHSDGPWREAAAAELWLANRTGPPPKPVAACRQIGTRPFLDGVLDDDCWQGAKPIVLKNAVGDTLKEYPTEAWVAYDKEYLYLALRCRHPEGQQVPAVKIRPHDADLRAFDRVSLLLDLDRDYSTYFHLQVDQRGCVCEDCWGDRTWDPRWFVAVHSDKTSWQIEAAIPLVELTGDVITLGRAWAFNVVRVLPGRGVQAFSVPADVQPRPEGMGLLMFSKDVAKKD